METYRRSTAQFGTQQCAGDSMQDVESPVGSVRSEKILVQPVVLQVELATKSQARLMQWVVWVVLILLIVLAFILFTNREDYLQSGSLAINLDFYYAVTIISSVSLAALLSAAALFVLRVRRAARQGRQWSKRQRALAAHAAVQLSLEVLVCTFWLAPNALVVASTCSWPAQVVAVFSVLRWTFFNSLLVWLMVMTHGMTRRQQSWDVRKAAATAARHGLTIGEGPGAASSYGSLSNKPCSGLPFSTPTGSSRGSICSQCQQEGTAQGGSVADQPGLPSQVAEPHPDGGPGAAQGGVLGVAGGGGALGVCPAGRPPSPTPLQSSSSVVATPSAAPQGCAPAAIMVPPGSSPSQSWHPGAAAHPLGGASGELKVGGSSAPPAAAVPAAPRARWSLRTLASAVLHDLWLQLPVLHPAPRGQGGECGCAAEGDAAPGCQLAIDGDWGEQAHTHWPKLLLWGVLEVFIILHTARQWGGDRIQIALEDDCGPSLSQECRLSSRDVASSIVFGVLVLVYVLLYLMYLYRAFRDHASLPYSHYRLTNIYIRVQLRHTSVALGAVAFTMLVDLGLGVNSCTAYLDSQMGSFPMQIALVQMVLVSSFLYLPATSLGAPLVQSMLQQFSWTEAGLPSLRRRRNAELASWLADEPTLEQRLLPALLPHLVPSAEEAGAGAEAALAREPVFCMERAVRLFYWSKLAYQYGNPQSIVTETTALRLFGLDQCKCIYEPSTNIRGLVGYGAGSTIVLCFRGTDGLKNVWTDIRSHLVLHAPKRRVQGQVVRVHGGFYSAWRQGGFRERVLEAVREVVEGGQAAGEGLTLHLTGHSLGGALAVLAAYDLRSHHPAARISVYTFGAPRVGSRAWYLDYSAAVPDTWGIINSQDPIPRIPKLFYKRCGERVTVNPRGDIIVRPSYFELSVINTSGGTVTHHMLWSYSLSLAAVIKAQFLPSKRLPGNQSGVRGLVSALDLGEALLLHNMDLKALQDPALPPKLMRVTRPKAARKLSGTLAGCSCAPWLPSGLSQQEGLQINAQEDEEEEEENGDVGIGLEDDKDARS